MSFILDALKKSEIERQRQTVPGLMDTRPAQQRRGLPVWAVALAVLLGINLIVLTVVLTRGNTNAALHTAVPAPPRPKSTRSPDRLPTVSPAAEAAPFQDASAASHAAGSGDAPAAAADHFSPLDTTPVYAPEIPVPAADGPSPASPTGRGAAAGSTGDTHALRRPDPLLVDEDARADNQEVLPSISEINLTGSLALPELHLDVHVYATKPAERFVYINMRKYREGSTLEEGPILERIRRDGVVLNLQGLRFVLPRQP